MKPPTPTLHIAASAPPASIISALPRRIWSNASIIAFDDDAHTEFIFDFKVSDIVIIKNAHRSNQNKEEVDAKALAELEKDL